MHPYHLDTLPLFSFFNTLVLASHMLLLKWVSQVGLEGCLGGSLNYVHLTAFKNSGCLCSLLHCSEICVFWNPVSIFFLFLKPPMILPPSSRDFPQCSLHPGNSLWWCFWRHHDFGCAPVVTPTFIPSGSDPTSVLPLVSDPLAQCCIQKEVSPSGNEVFWQFLWPIAGWTITTHFSSIFQLYLAAK